MPDATWNGKAWVTDDGTVVSTDPNAGTPAGGEAGGWTDSLPAIGGTVASMMAGSKATPTGLAASAVGGMVGEVARKNITRDAPSNWREVVEGGIRTGLPLTQLADPDVLKAGASQGLMEGVGRTAAAALKPIGKMIYGRIGLRPAKALRDEYGYKNIVDEAYGSKLLPTERGVDRAGRMLGTEYQKAGQMAAGADAAGRMPPSVDQMLAPVADVMKKVQKKAASVPGFDDNSREIMENVVNVVRKRGNRMNNVETLEAKRLADEAASDAWDVARREGMKRVPTGSAGEQAMASAKGYNAALKDTLGSGYEQSAKRTQTLYGVRKALAEAKDKPEMLTTMMMGGMPAVGGYASGGWETAGKAGAAGTTMAMMLSPRGATSAGLMLPMAGKYVPRGLDMLTGGEVGNSLRDSIMAMMEDAMKRSTETP